MKRLLLAACVCLVGCGGSGGGGNGQAGGDFSGTWGAPNNQVTPPPGDTGNFALTINSGTVTGTCTKGSEVGNVTGTLQNGQLNATVDYPTSPDWDIKPVYTVPLNVSNTLIQGNVWVGTEEYNRTIHKFLTRVVLNRQ